MSKGTPEGKVGELERMVDDIDKRMNTLKSYRERVEGDLKSLNYDNVQGANSLETVENLRQRHADSQHRRTDLITAMQNEYADLQARREQCENLIRTLPPAGDPARTAELNTRINALTEKMDEAKFNIRALGAGQNTPNVARTQGLQDQYTAANTGLTDAIAAKRAEFQAQQQPHRGGRR